MRRGDTISSQAVVEVIGGKEKAKGKITKKNKAGLLQVTEQMNVMFNNTMFLLNS